MRMKILFGDEPGGWTVNGLDRSGGKFPMEGDRQDMCRAPFGLALQLGVAAPDRNGRKTELPEDPKDLPGR